MSEEEARNSEDPVKYKDVFGVGGELGEKPIKPEDAAMMKSAEAAVLGPQAPMGAGPAAAMQSAADANVCAGLVGPADVTDVAAKQGVTVTGTTVPGARIVTESVAGQILEQYILPLEGNEDAPQGSEEGGGQITIGQALEAAAQTIPEKPVDYSDAAAIQAAEIRATGNSVIAPDGVAASAQLAAAHNEDMMNDENKVKLKDVLSGASKVLSGDKVATRQDAVGVVAAEMRNKEDMSPTPGGVAASITVAARLNERTQIQSS